MPSKSSKTAKSTSTKSSKSSSKSSIPPPPSSTTPSTVTSSEVSPSSVQFTEFELKFNTLCDESQHTFAVHSRNVNLMLSLCKSDSKDNYKNFVNSVLSVISRVLDIFKREAAVERIVEFIANIISKLNIEIVTESVFNYLLSYMHSDSKSHRFRACHLLSVIFNNMDENAEISENLFEKLTVSLLERSKDKISAIRVQAIEAMNRLQTEANENDTEHTINCPITAEYYRLLESDPIAEVRKTVIKHINFNKDSLQKLLIRCRDSAPTVRIAAFSKLVQSTRHFKYLQVQQRAILMKSGLTERDLTVKQVAGELLNNIWLIEKCNSDCIQLLERLGAEIFCQEAEIVVKYLVENKLDIINNNTQQPPYKQDVITPEKALYWRVKIETLLKMNKNNNNNNLILLDSYFPDTVEFVSLLSWSRSNPFICFQLLQLSLHIDLSDEAGCRELSKICIELLTDLNCSPYLIEPIMKLLRHISIVNIGNTQDTITAIEQGEKHYVQQIIELLSDIRDPIEVKYNNNTNEESSIEQAQKQRIVLETRLNHVNTELESLKVNKQQLIETEDYENLTSIKSKIIEKQQELNEIQEKIANFSLPGDENIWFRLLSIVGELLKQTTRQNLSNNSVITGLLHSTIVPALASNNIEIKVLAINCLGLYLLLDSTVARDFVPILYSALIDESHIQNIQIIGLKAITDCWLMFENLIIEQEMITNIENILINGIKNLQYCEFAPNSIEDELKLEYCSTVVECSCKLLLFSRIGNDNEDNTNNNNKQEILSSLLKYWKPEYKNYIHAVQCLQVFFQAYAQLKQENKDLLIQSIENKAINTSNKTNEKVVRASKNKAVEKMQAEAQNDKTLKKILKKQEDSDSETEQKYKEDTEEDQDSEGEDALKEEKQIVQATVPVNEDESNLVESSLSESEESDYEPENQPVNRRNTKKGSNINSEKQTKPNKKPMVEPVKTSKSKASTSNKGTKSRTRGKVK